MRKYSNVKLYDSENQDLEVKMNQILEQRRQEKQLEMQAEEASFGPVDDVED